MVRKTDDKNKRGMGAIYNDILYHGRDNRFWIYSKYMYFHKGLSLYNSAMIVLQRPGAGYVATKDEWAQYNRKVMQSASAINILRPFYPTVAMYEYSDTALIADCEDLTPDRFKTISPHNKCEKFDDKWLYLFKNILFKLGIAFREDMNSANLGGTATYLTEAIRLYPEIKNNKTVTKFIISVRASDDESEKARTILHETAHILCGHLGTDSGNKKCVPVDRENMFLQKDAKHIAEYEAELTCDAVCKILGIENDSKKYLEFWKYHGETPNYNRGIVLDTADKILQAIDRKYCW